MPISFYSGQPRAGKTYQCVLNFVVPAVRAGRRVISNIDGLNADEIHDYIDKTGGLPPGGKYGDVVYVRSDDIEAVDFFPLETDPMGGFVKPGDVLAFDEVSTIFPTGGKMTKRTMHFLAFHGHYVSEGPNGRSTDIALIAQSIDMIPRNIRNLVAFHYRARRLVALGMPKRYDLVWWEGAAMRKDTMVGSERKKFNPAVFRLFASSHGGGANAVVQSDKRMIIWRRPAFWVPWAFICCMIVFGVYRMTTRGIVPGGAGGGHHAIGSAHAQGAGAGQPAAPRTILPAPPPPAVAEDGHRYSEHWKVVGTERFGTVTNVVLENSSGSLRVVPDARFRFRNGDVDAGVVDGEEVAGFTGTPTAGPSPLSSVLH